MAGRAKDFQPACAEPLSFQELRERIATKEDKKGQQAAAAAAVAAASSGVVDPESEDDTVVENADVQGGALDKASTKKKRQQQPGAKKGGTAVKARPKTTKGAQVPVPESDKVSGKGSDTSKLFGSLDEDMVSVAKAHLSTAQGSSANSLVKLNPMYFLLYNTEDAKASPALSNTLNGMPWANVCLFFAIPLARRVSGQSLLNYSLFNTVI